MKDKSSEGYATVVAASHEGIGGGRSKRRLMWVSDSGALPTAAMLEKRVQVVVLLAARGAHGEERNVHTVGVARWSVVLVSSSVGAFSWRTMCSKAQAGSVCACVATCSRAWLRVLATVGGGGSGLV
jgi:hypothetical protein